jgi:dinuclear metal center YbgI/SA1388 family protein
MARLPSPRRDRAAPAPEPRTVAAVHAALDRIAPFALAAEWDNVGLLAGRMDWPARRILAAIDLTDAVAREALRRGANVLLTYHPVIFKGIRAVTPAAEAPTALLPDLLAARVALLAVHTALDAAPGGTNDVLLDMLNVASRHPLQSVLATDRGYKLVVFVPAPQAAALRSALARAGAGTIGHYHECSFELAGQGTFRGDASTRPTIGRRGVLERVDELRLEMVVPAACVGPVVRALYATHSYEEPAFDLYPLHELPARGAAGLGRVGVLGRPAGGMELLRRLRSRIGLRGAMVIGDLRRRFRSVTAAAGAFGARSFRDPHSLVLTGELKHHEALELHRRGVTAVCLGHYASERPALERLVHRVREELPGARVRVARADKPPATLAPDSGKR